MFAGEIGESACFCTLPAGQAAGRTFWLSFTSSAPSRSNPKSFLSGGRSRSDADTAIDGLLEDQELVIVQRQQRRYTAALR